MSATNKTTYYELPIFIGSDTPSWLGDWNNAMTDIDGDMNSIKGAADNALSVANSAENKSDNNTETLNSLSAVVDTIKEAVQNYDQILDFKQANVAIASNNLRPEYGGAFMSQNTNKTLSKLYLLGRFNKPISNLTSYNYNTGDGTNTWVDLFTVEDNCFNLTQGSQPSFSNALTIGALTWRRTSDNVAFARFLRAWYDGATTHFGMEIYGGDEVSTDLAGSYVWTNATVFLTGSIYNPVNPDEN